MSKLDIYSRPIFERRSSIICTIGPKTKSVEMMTALMDSGMNIVRLNFSHGDHEYHGSVIAAAREAAALRTDDKLIAIALDTKGPEIRTGDLETGADVVTLEAGSRVRVSTNEDDRNKCSAELIFVDYPLLPASVKSGGTIYIDDGLICLKVLEIESVTSLIAIVQNTGDLGSRKGVNLPEVDVQLPAVSNKDI